MRIDIPNGLIPFARDFSIYKTPAVRTQGWTEQPHETRGVGDIMDTIGSLMLWRYLAERNVPVTYMLTARQGDETDLRVTKSGKKIDINVKTSAWQPKQDDDPCRFGRVAVKEEELQKELPDIFLQVIVHMNPPRNQGGSHVHLCNWIESASPEFQRQEIQIIPNSDNTPGYWIPKKDCKAIEDLIPRLRSSNE